MPVGWPWGPAALVSIVTGRPPPTPEAKNVAQAPDGADVDERLGTERPVGLPGVLTKRMGTSRRVSDRSSPGGDPIRKVCTGLKKMLSR